MATFKVSQGELWHRIYIIEAETLEAAKRIYQEYLAANHDDLADDERIYEKSPEYIEDIDDVVWFDDKGGVVSFNG